VYIKKRNDINELNKKCKCTNCIHCDIERVTHASFLKNIYICSWRSGDVLQTVCCYEYHGSMEPTEEYREYLHKCTRYKSITKKDNNLFSQYQLF